MKNLLLISFITCSCLMAISGCAPTAQIAPETATGLVELRHAMTSGKIHLERSIKALEDLAKSPRSNTQQQIALFVRELEELDAEVVRINGIDDRIQASADAHFAAWEAELQNIQNPKVAAAGQSRRKKTKETVEAIKKRLHQASEVVTPLLSNLQDIHRSLEQDKTAEGVISLKKPIQDTLAMRTDAMRKIDDIIQYIDQVTQSVQ